MQRIARKVGGHDWQELLSEGKWRRSGILEPRRLCAGLLRTRVGRNSAAAIILRALRPSAAAEAGASGPATAGPRTAAAMIVTGNELSTFPASNASMGRSYSAFASGKEGKAPAVVADGKVSFPVRKKRQSSFAEEQRPIAKPREASNPTELAGGKVGFALVEAAESPSLTAVSTARVETLQVKRQSTRLRRAAERVESSEASPSDVRSEGGVDQARAGSGRSRRASKTSAGTSRRRKAVVAVAASKDLPTADITLSSLSETAGKGVLDAAKLPIVAGKALSAPEDVAAVLEYLKSVDPLLKTVIEMSEGPKFKECTSAFASLAQSIVYQQLATKAAAAIFGRLVDLCQGLENLTPTTMSQLTTQQLRAVGLSERKASYLHDLSSNFLSGALSDSLILSMDDDALMTALTKVKGIGVWSVHMFMLFSLHKPDVLPVGDLGVRKGFQRLYKLKELPTPAQVENIASSWQPYRSLGSWYMWRVLNDNAPLKEAT